MKSCPCADPTCFAVCPCPACSGSGARGSHQGFFCPRCGVELQGQKGFCYRCRRSW